MAFRAVRLNRMSCRMAALFSSRHHDLRVIIAVKERAAKLSTPHLVLSHWHCVDLCVQILVLNCRERQKLDATVFAQEHGPKLSGATPNWDLSTSAALLGRILIANGLNAVSDRTLDLARGVTMEPRLTFHSFSENAPIVAGSLNHRLNEHD